MPEHLPVVHCSRFDGINLDDTQGLNCHFSTNEHVNDITGKRITGSVNLYSPDGQCHPKKRIASILAKAESLNDTPSYTRSRNRSIWLASIVLCSGHLTLDKQVSCIVNAHKEGSYLHRSLHSAIRNTEFARLLGIKAEILVVLDNANTETIEVAESIVQRSDETIRLIHCEYGDLGESRNRGVLEASGDYIAFLDGDDLWGDEWLSGAFIQSLQTDGPCIVHPEFNIYFSKKYTHVVQHIAQDDPSFFKEYFHEQNYWTSLSFSAKGVYLDHPYKTNDLSNYFGYEDWTWNYETLCSGIFHTIVKNSTHYIRRGKREPSLLDQTSLQSMPRIYPLYNKTLKNIIERNQPETTSV